MKKYKLLLVFLLAILFVGTVTGSIYAANSFPQDYNSKIAKNATDQSKTLVSLNSQWTEGKTLDIIRIDDIIITNDNKETPKKTFTDLQGHWAAANIQTLVQKGAISGYPDGSFQPNRTITRAEFATVLVKALNLNLQSGKTFTDTQNHWAKDYISTAYHQGIVKGMNETQFAPDAEISREQMAIMIVNARKLSNSQSPLNFADTSLISPWALQAVATAVENKIFSGYPDNTFRPQGFATRAEAVTAIIKAM